MFTQWCMWVHVTYTPADIEWPHTAAHHNVTLHFNTTNLQCSTLMSACFRLYKFKSAVVLQFPLPIPQHIPGENKLSQYYTPIINFNIRHTESESRNCETSSTGGRATNTSKCTQGTSGTIMEFTNTHADANISQTKFHCQKYTPIHSYLATQTLLIASADPGVCIAASDTQHTSIFLTLRLVVPA